VFHGRCHEREEVICLEDKALLISQSRHNDAHKVIRHVTAALLDAHPGPSLCLALTDSTFAAIKKFVFCELYDSIFEKIKLQFREQDASLKKNISEFQGQ
jgi:hypothetical protein